MSNISETKKDQDISKNINLQDEFEQMFKRVEEKELYFAQDEQDRIGKELEEDFVEKDTSANEKKENPPSTSFLNWNENRPRLRGGAPNNNNSKATNKNVPTSNESMIRRKLPRTKFPEKREATPDPGARSQHENMDGGKSKKDTPLSSSDRGSSTDSNETKSVTSLLMKSIENVSKKKPSARQLKEVQETVIPENKDKHVEKNFIPAVYHCQYILWNVPFITLLNCIAMHKDSFMDLVHTMIPSTKAKPQLTAKSSSSNRTAKYWIIDEAIGKTLRSVGASFGFELKEGKTYSLQKSIYVEARKQLQRFFQEGKVMLQELRDVLTTAPSIYLYFPPIYVFGIMAHLGSIGGEKGSDEVHDEMTTLFEGYIDDDHVYPRDAIDMVVEQINEDSLVHDLDAAQSHVLRLCASFHVDKDDWHFGLQKTAYNKSTNRKANAFQSAITDTQVQYRDAIRKLTGIRFRYEKGTAVDVCNFPIINLGYLILRGYSQNLDENMYIEVMRKFTVMMADIDTSLFISDAATDENRDGQYEQMSRIYGYHTNRIHHVRPWENIYQLYMLNRQIGDMMDITQYVEKNDEDEEDEEKPTQLEKFQQFVQYFIFCAVTVDKDFITNDSPFSVSVFRRRLRYFLSTDSLPSTKKQ